MVVAVVGINWGDEGKGRMVDWLARDMDVVVRYQGGSNAGHTVVNDLGTFKLHLIPSGIFSPKVVNVLGPGAVVNLEACVKEMADLKAKGVAIGPDSYKISERALICFPFHKLQDEYEEERLGAGKFGSTKQGIAPVYGDRYMKTGLQMGDLAYPDYFRAQLARTLESKNLLFTRVYGKPAVSLDSMMEWAMEYGRPLLPHVADTMEILSRAEAEGKNILLEAQLGSLRDVMYGIYPFTTSSTTLAGFGGVGSGWFGKSPVRTVGVMKAFSTCVGEGPFTTEITGELANAIREVAFEYGAATGRPRRIGWFDAVASRYGAQVQGVDDIAITKLDSLSGQKSLKICTHYEIEGKKTDRFPITARLVQASPVSIDMPGWKEDISGVREFSRLPAAAREYVETIERLVGRKIRYVSVGPERDSLIIRD